MKIPRWDKKNWFFLLVVFVLIFPKGGVKIAEVPLTWGYLLIGLTACGILLKKQWIISRNHLFILVTQIPFQLIALLHFQMQGVQDRGAFLAFLTHFFFFPIVFFALFSRSIETLDIRFFNTLLKRGISLVSIYGIVLFFFRIVVGKFLYVPLLTANLHDLNILELTKCISRGNLFKLISTYNNGNIYGICILMILPYYQTIEQNRWKKRVVKLSLILTLSRTIWAGLLIEELMTRFFIHPLTRQTVVNFLYRWGVFIGSIGIVLYYLNYDVSFAFDSTLGGRIRQFESIADISWLGQFSFVAFEEIIYLSILKNFGLLGLFSFILSMTIPLGIYLMTSKPSPDKKSLFSGLFLYLIMACSDGAILLIPVMAFYWFISGLLTSGLFHVSETA